VAFQIRDRCGARRHVLQPLRAVGGDYFDVIDLPGGRTPFAVADVSGKGSAAALLTVT
jgi:serine phosphatase RsbU (regulator of sigma subunit)